MWYLNNENIHTKFGKSVTLHHRNDKKFVITTTIYIISASQKERITILKLVLEEKGVNTKSAHYSATPGSVPNIGSVDSERRQQPAENNSNTTPTTTTDGRALTNREQVIGVGADGDGGVYL